MSIKSLIIISLFLGIPSCIFAQIMSEKKVHSIEFQGLKKTQPTYLKTFIQSKVDESFSETIVTADIQRLKNVAGVGNASYYLDTVDQKINLIFEIKEVKTLLPIVNFGGIKGNVWFQLGFTDINWQGKGHTLSAAYQNTDRRHSGYIFYRLPRIKQSNWGFSANINTWASREPLYFEEGTVNYDYDIRSIGLTAIRHFGLRHRFEFGGTFFEEEYVKSDLQFLEVTPGPDDFTQPKLLAKWEYKADYLNYHFFYINGLTWKLNLQNVYNTFDKTWFNSLQFQGRYFKTLGTKTNFAARLRLAIATNISTPFAPFVVDSHVNLRGVGNRIDRGTAQAVLNLELRQTFLDTKLWAGQIVGFSDLGTWRNPGGELKDLFNSDQFRHFIGGGIRVIYQKVYGAVLRIDYGIDVYNTNQRGLVIGFGQYF